MTYLTLEKFLSTMEQRFAEPLVKVQSSVPFMTMLTQVQELISARTSSTVSPVASEETLYKLLHNGKE